MIALLKLLNNFLFDAVSDKLPEERLIFALSSGHHRQPRKAYGMD